MQDGRADVTHLDGRNHCAVTQPELCYFLVTLVKMRPGQAWPADGGK